jgi:hypothetical protein
MPPFQDLTMRDLRLAAGALGFPQTLVLPSFAAIRMLSLAASLAPGPADADAGAVQPCADTAGGRRAGSDAYTHGPWLSARWREHDFHHHRNEYVAYGTLTGSWDGVLEASVVW